MPGREFEIIRRYFTGVVTSTTERVVLGPGDDCAILDVPAGQQLCVSTDTLVSGVHFPDDASAEVAAHRSLCANLSDLAAMGATPLAFLGALTLPGEDDGWLDAFSRTLAALADEYRIPLVGGNLARGELSITLTVLGSIPAGAALRRDGARPGDEVYVTGTLGDAAGWLALEQASGETSRVRDADHLRRRYCSPTPRLGLGERLRGVASGMIDISDGLAADLGHICESSAVGARIDATVIPLSNALRSGFEQRALALAIGGGDDYELCFTAAPDRREDIAALATDTGVGITRIGEIVEGTSPVFVDGDGNAMALEETGYQHFRTP